METAARPQVLSIKQLDDRQLRVNVTANVGLGLPPDADPAVIDAAVASVTHLSKDASVRNLTWSHTTDALGSRAAVVSDDFATRLQTPRNDDGVDWPKIVFPIIAGPRLLRPRHVHLCMPILRRFTSNTCCRDLTSSTCRP